MPLDLMKMPPREAEALAYAEGFHGTAQLFARLEDAHARMREVVDVLNKLPLGSEALDNAPREFVYALLRLRREVERDLHDQKGLPLQ